MILKRSNLQKFQHWFFENDLLNENGVLIVEHSKYTKLDDLPYFSHARKYGGSVFSFFEAIENTEAEQ